MNMSDSAISMGLSVYGELRRKREGRGISQQVIADRLRCSREHFNKVEGGFRTVSADQLFVWAEFLGLRICVQQVTSDQKSQATERTAA
jgi:transcriptional regulator with XRE-family HTH domain